MHRRPFDPSLIPEPLPDKPTAKTPITVSQLTALVKQALATSIPPTVHVVGEITNFKRHSTGHLYFTLKDSGSELACVMWRSAAQTVKFRPEDGLEVVATGGIEVFERTGRYQLYVRKMEPRGAGALELAFRQLHEKLQKEGLFDPRHKKPLPKFPTRVVVVTSPTGAAIHDILQTLRRRFPCLDVLLFPVRVQGDGAAQEIAAAIRRVDANAAALGGIDVMIVGRGGGSLEDLWPFNEEVVARAIFACRIPVISAVGHEVNVTIADLVADLRAPTPTAAAELAVPALADVLSTLDSTQNRLARALTHHARLAASRLAAMHQRAAFRQPLDVVYRREQLLDELTHRMQRSLVFRLHTARRRIEADESILQRIAPHAYLIRASRRLADLSARLTAAVKRREALASARADSAGPRMQLAMKQRILFLHQALRGQADRLAALGYRSILNRGFSITRLKRSGRVIRDLAQVRDGDRVTTELSSGQFESEVVNLRQLGLFE